MTAANTGSANYEQNIDKMYGNQQRGRSEGIVGGMGSAGFGGYGGNGGFGGYGGSSGGSMSQFDSHINDMYDSYLEGQKATLQSGYETDVSNLDAEKEAARKETDTNLTRTYIEAAKKAKNYNEVQNAYGLTSGAMAQAQLASGNQLQGDLTGIRNQGADTMAEIERQRSILAKEYAAAIAKAQADNDFQRAQALYEAAQKEQDRLQQIKLQQMQFEQQVRMFQMQQEAASGGGGGYSGGGSGYSSYTPPASDDAEETAPAKSSIPVVSSDASQKPHSQASVLWALNKGLTQSTK